METAVLVALIGIGGTLGAQIIFAIFTNRRENGRRTHERSLKQMELEDNRQERRRDERIQAYRNLAKITVTIDPAEPPKLGDLAEAYSEIELVWGSDRVQEATRQLYGTAFRARRKARETSLAGKDPTEDLDTKAVIEEAMECRTAFIELARKELGQQLPVPQQ